jgi:hypothetical protein
VLLAVSGDTTITMSILQWIVGLSATVGAGTLAAAVTLRNTVNNLTKDFEEFQGWRKELRQQSTREREDFIRWQSSVEAELKALKRGGYRQNTGPTKKAD